MMLAVHRVANRDADGVLLGVWAVLTAVRVTGREEDAGRWDQLLAGRLRLTGL